MLRKVRNEDSSITIILPGEKRKVEKDEIDTVVKIKTSVLKLEFKCGIHTWRAEGIDSRVKQVKEIICYYYLFDETEETQNTLNEVIEKVLMTEADSVFR